MKILVAGGTGFVGRHLVPVLLRHGHDVSVMTRHPHTRPDAATKGSAKEVHGDVSDSLSLAGALRDIDVAVYLVHTLDRPDFVERDRIGAQTFAAQAARSGVSKVVYLGGLGNDDDDLSPHLRSRREVEQILSAALPTLALRAGIVVGDGSVSWEILCQLVERLPVMITPRWVQTRTQPIALDDAVAYLAAAVELDHPSDHFDIGAPESTTYQEMLRSTAEQMGRSLHILPVPVLSPGLSSRWLRLVTDVDLQTARSLVDSMTNEVVATDRRLEQITGRVPISFEAATRLALDQRGRRKANQTERDVPAAD